MIGSLTFTYGDNRFDIFKYKSRDLIDKKFRNKLDFNLYLFHNSPDSYIQQVKESKLLDGFNLKLGKITGTYPQALQAALIQLKSLGIRKIFFMQDDVFSCMKDFKIYEEMLTYAKKTTLPYFSIEHFDQTNTIDILERNETFNILNTTTKWFREKGWWSWDDGVYFGDIDYAMNSIYDGSYFNYPDIWAAEHYLNHKFSQTNIQRPICDKQFFRRVNFVGNNDWNKVNELKFLNDFFV